jgi:glycosyltransferase involved in cell wall biosynthesis
VLTHRETAGKGRSIRTGLAHVLPSGEVDYVLILDGDLQHRPDEAPRLIAAARETGADLIVGERQFDRASMPASRYYANVVGSWALSSFMGSPLRDTQCGYRLFKTEMLRRLRLRATGYDIETEMLVKVGRMGGRIAHVPVTAVYTGAPSKLRPMRDTTRTCFRAVYYRYLERL